MIQSVLFSCYALVWGCFCCALVLAAVARWAGERSRKPHFEVGHVLLRGMWRWRVGHPGRGHCTGHCRNTIGTCPQVTGGGAYLLGVVGQVGGHTLTRENRGERSTWSMGGGRWDQGGEGGSTGVSSDIVFILFVFSVVSSRLEKCGRCGICTVLVCLIF